MFLLTSYFLFSKHAFLLLSHIYKVTIQGVTLLLGKTSPLICKKNYRELADLMKSTYIIMLKVLQERFKPSIF